MGLSICTNGERVTRTQIDFRKRKAYEAYDQENGIVWCEGCGRPATCHAHIIPQARCKQLHATELIWHWGNFFASCFECNQAIENPKGEAWKKLANKDYCLSFIEMHDQELYNKFITQLP